MEVNGQHQTSVVLSPGRKAVAHGRGGCVGPRAILNVLEEKKSLVSIEIRTLYCPPLNTAPVPTKKDFLNMTFNPAVQRIDCDTS